MDRKAIFGAFGCHAGPDCLKDILPLYGQRIKVYRTIKTNEVSKHMSTCI